MSVVQDYKKKIDFVVPNE